MVRGAGHLGRGADGDPASRGRARLPGGCSSPQDAGLLARQQAQLGAVLIPPRGAAGYPLRVAVIASPTDLGSITELWRRPASYARFLGQELSLVYLHGTLLVVMPDAGPDRVTVGYSDTCPHERSPIL